jgi:hypothetical protein
LAKQHLVGPVPDLVVREDLEKGYRFFPVRRAAVRRLWLPGPEYINICCMAFIKRYPVLGIPGIIQRLHEAHVLFNSRHVGSPFVTIVNSPDVLIMLFSLRSGEML